jgi:hypothetical protein
MLLAAPQRKFAKIKTAMSPAAMQYILAATVQTLQDGERSTLCSAQSLGQKSRL